MHDRTDHGWRLMQVMYDPRFGMMAFFEDGTVAEATTLPNGKRTWTFAENIWDEGTANDLMPKSAVK